MLLSGEAFVLVRHAYTESSWIVSLFMRDHGLLRAVARGARKTRSGGRGSLEPMTKIQVEVFLREGRDLGQVRRAEVLAGAMDLFEDWPRAEVLLGMCEILERGLPAQSPEEETFRLVEALMDPLREGLDPALAWLYFVLWFSRLHGHLARPKPSSELGGEEERLRSACLRNAPGALAGLSVSPSVVVRLARRLEGGVTDYLGAPLRSAPSFRGR
ncbi:MAG: DNA repair protein RecO [Acidobacteriota bacterium]